MQLIPMIQMTAAVGLGGAAGAIGRHAIAELMRVATSWPAWAGTLAANLLGCFLIGVAFSVLEGLERPEYWRGLLVTGLLGAFTTFSTFSLDAMHLIDDRRFGELAAYVALSLLVGLASCKAGVAITEALRQHA